MLGKNVKGRSQTGFFSDEESLSDRSEMASAKKSLDCCFLTLLWVRIPNKLKILLALILIVILLALYGWTVLLVFGRSNSATVARSEKRKANYNPNKAAEKTTSISTGPVTRTSRESASNSSHSDDTAESSSLPARRRRRQKRFK